MIKSFSIPFETFFLSAARLLSAPPSRLLSIFLTHRAVDGDRTFNFKAVSDPFQTFYRTARVLLSDSPLSQSFQVLIPCDKVLSDSLHGSWAFKASALNPISLFQ